MVRIVRSNFPVALLRCVAVVVIGFSLSGALYAADPMDALKKATKALTSGGRDAAKDLDAFDAAHATAIQAWQSVPFMIRKIVLTEEKAVGSGMYKERGNSAYKKGESIYVYLEPIGYAWKSLGSDLYSFGFVADLIIRSETGEVLLDKKGLINGDFTSHKKNMEAYMNASIDVEELPDGAYTLEFTVRDKHSTAVSEVKQGFTYTNAN